MSRQQPLHESPLDDDTNEGGSSADDDLTIDMQPARNHESNRGAGRDATRHANLEPSHRVDSVQPDNRQGQVSSRKMPAGDASISDQSSVESESVVEETMYQSLQQPGLSGNGRSPTTGEDQAAAGRLSPQRENLIRFTAAEECQADPDLVLLHSRLKVVAFLLGSILLAMMFAYMFATRISGSLPMGLMEPLPLWLRISNGLGISSLFGCGFLLLKLKRSICWQLHTIELFIFGIPSVLFVFLEYQYIVQYVMAHDILPTITTGWILLMFTYALYIPNHWQRAAIFMSVFAILPATLAIYLAVFHKGCCEAINADISYVTQSTTQLLVGATTSIFGVAMIGGLRQQASEARELGQYVLLEKLGEGGMGEVFLGEHRLMKRPCAIKLIRPERAGDPKILGRFEREVRLTAQLSHWNNVDIYDYGRAEDGTFFYVMEYLPGLTLRKLVDRYGPLPPGRVIYLLQQVCQALDEAHRHHLIHRDIKPSNIIAAERGGVFDVAKLLDFGLAKPLLDTDAVNYTLDQVVTGSPRYMSPEQATGEAQPDARSDIYSLGCVAYFLLTGQPPFDETQVIRAIMAHVTKTPLEPSKLRTELPQDLVSVVMRCLAKDPDDRYRSAMELRRALLDCRDAEQWDEQAALEWWANVPLYRA